MAKTRNGQNIEVGQKYAVQDLAGVNIYTVTEIIDADSVRIDDFYKSTRWACNVLYKVS